MLQRRLAGGYDSTAAAAQGAGFAITDLIAWLRRNHTYR